MSSTTRSIYDLLRTNRRHSGIVPLALLFLACSQMTTPPATSPPPRFPQIDHVIIAIDNLDRGIELLSQATGVKPAYGGAHPGRRTQNALLSLGHNQYLELIAPNPADTSATARGFRSQLDEHFSKLKTLTPDGWAIRATNADAERARLIATGLKPSAVRPGSRARPGGQLLQWKTFDPWGAENDILPFVIEWAAGTPHPSASAPSGCTLASFVIGTTSPDSFATLLGKADYRVQIHRSARDQIELILDCPRGRVALP
jgi:hypothetical protein